MYRHLTGQLKPLLPHLAGGICAAAMLVVGPQRAPAQSANSKNLPAASKVPAAAKSQPKSAAKAVPPSAAEIAARDSVLRSEDWQKTVGEFKKWLDMQSLYDDQQVTQINARLDQGIKRMTADQLHRFMSSMYGKMKIFTSDRAEEAQAYLAETFEVASPAYARRIRQRLPDPLTASAAQVDHALTMLVSKRQNAIELQKKFDIARQQVVEYNQAQARARQVEIAREQPDVESERSPPLKTNNFDYPIGDAFNTGWDGQAGVTWTLGGYRF
jgi:hypothetical protein